MLHWQRAGHQLIALIGGATALIGDPSGKASERIALPEGKVRDNADVIAENITRIFQNHQKYIWEQNRDPNRLKPVKLVNNADWYNNVSITKFLSTAGRHFRVGAMLSRNSVQSRINSEAGISFTEFSYQVLQGYDWLHLLQTYKCRFQIGGSDQMGNIVSGHELISRMGLDEVFGLTIPLVTNEEGSKLGKTADNAVWITPSKTSPFELYQFFMRVKRLGGGTIIEAVYVFFDRRNLPDNGETNGQTGISDRSSQISPTSDASCSRRKRSTVSGAYHCGIV